MSEQDSSGTQTPAKQNFFNLALKRQLFLLFVGFVLTGILGAVVTFYFQCRANYLQNKEVLIEAQRNRASDAFIEITKAMDSRAYCSQLVVDYFTFPNAKILPAEKWNTYADQLTNWDDNINRRTKEARSFFGTKVYWGIWDIHNRFIDLNKKLDAVKLQGNKTPLYSEAKKEIDEINGLIAQLSGQMEHQIEAGETIPPPMKPFNFFDY